MLREGTTCPICGHGRISERIIVKTFTYKSQKMLIPNYRIFECDTCEEKVVSSETLRGTEKVLTDFRRKVDDLLTSDEIKRIREKLDKTQKEMAIFLGVGEKNFARYENGQVTQSKTMDTLLRILDTDPNILSKVSARKEMQTDYEELPVEPCVVSETKQGKDIKYSQEGISKDYGSNTETAYAA